MADTFYRVHWADCPPFSAENAWSLPWGPERSADGSRYACGCDGREADCAPCGGTGWMDADRGYSCTWDAEDLIEYFGHAARDGVVGDDDRVIVFEGRWVGDGGDGEPLAIPSRVLETLTWEEFIARHHAPVRQ